MPAGHASQRRPKGSPPGRTGDYYRRALALTAIAGLGRLPQVVLPGGRTTASPVGLSLVGAWGQDMLVLSAANRLIGGSVPLTGSRPEPSDDLGAGRSALPKPTRSIPWRMVGAGVGLVAAVILLGSFVSWLKSGADYSRPITPDELRRLRIGW